MTKRTYDVVIFGATGFTGRLVAEYLAAEYGSAVRWAMAGRSLDKLALVRDEIGAPADTPLIAADSSDPASLAAMAEQTAAVITTVGPYQLYGEALVKACVDAGTDYVDLCGEPAWMHDIIAAHDAPARDSGARIVLSCGFDSIPFDLGVYFLQSHAIDQTGAPLARIKGRVRKMKGTFSGGTAASFAQTMARAAKEPEVINRLRDPFSLVPGFDGPRQPSGSKVIFEDDLNTWSAPFIMASINTKNVHRSNALLGHRYGEDFVYDEMFSTGPGEQGEQFANMIANDKSMAENPPKPGEGPSKEERETGFYDAMFTGVTPDGTRLTAGVSGDKDPGYGSTSKMIAEAALCLVQNVDRAQTAGGVYTPAPAMGDALITRLQEHAGLKFVMES
ncbi:MAG: saccharopine dehydrogenase NADP-binding domain-containing protein [Maricaulis sp.]|uniref:saccharopine dehydrogenase family protein n=1 Tax=Maricaulis sp. TaxID=1486257 RepID=UPI001B268E1D|nr:saccharopine dehydrogenase NADP-binding domain-containing protein [Maricaulis sp.]MBO6729940.1 saccharopine dehydrogenase NADP-binding domain-containing protein [Maricaulis sp.]MBO6848021.1 saccharopine dehydrogenase NADP-binding domain-containing protein [Maricaulis sp.]MBO6878076.1 saccharopine dehydrogenase NADP-binding domain-containing protein [Maricaulis sp.]